MAVRQSFSTVASQALSKHIPQKTSDEGDSAVARPPGVETLRTSQHHEYSFFAS